MADPAPVWIVMVRDATDSATVAGMRHTMISMIVDGDTGMVRGVSVGASARNACTDAMNTALTTAMGPVAPGRPRAVLVSGVKPAEVRAGLIKLIGSEALPPVEPVDPVDQAEDIFDSLVGQLAGRRQPAEFATPDDWRALVAAGAAYARAKPWRSWSDEDVLRVVVGVDGVSAPCVGLVLGAAGTQIGFNLIPGTQVPARMDRWRPGQPLPMPSGSMILWLDSAAETGSVFVNKARRYGWPTDLDLWPTWLAVEKGDPSDLGRDEVRRLTVALVAVVSRHADLMARTEPRWSGSATLADGAHAKYTFRG
jgi:hypothetical protein